MIQQLVVVSKRVCLLFPRLPQRFGVVGIVAALAFFGGLASAGVTGNVVISQVYGGGGNARATFRNDFIELFNRSNVAVNLSGWSVQYASATGTT